jgi:hypothetical protein
MSTMVGIGMWASTGEPEVVPVAMAAGVLPDLDHLFDYYLWWVRRERRFLFLLLHGWEYLALLIVLYLFVINEPWLLAATLGYTTQIASDQFMNKPSWRTYLITVRALHGFKNVPILGKEPQFSANNSVVTSLPFGKERVKKWFETRT